MKKVRFESPRKLMNERMEESECHSPRPFLERRVPAREPGLLEFDRVIYSVDPVHRFEYSDLSPYPLAKKTVLPTVSDMGPNCSPSSDLNLSMLDVHDPRPRPPTNSNFVQDQSRYGSKEKTNLHSNILSSIENTSTPPNVLIKDDSFFIKRDNLNKYNLNVKPLQQQLYRLNLDKENNPITRKAEIARSIAQNQQVNTEHQEVVPANNTSDCNCHHCIKVKHTPHCLKQVQNHPHDNRLFNLEPHKCNYQAQIMTCFHCKQHVQSTNRFCNCTPDQNSPKTAVNKKTLAIEKYEQSNKTDSMDIEKQTKITKEKREPTISDLLKIIKLQNEQLQLLQEKVDKFISVSSNKVQSVPVQNYMTEHVALQTIDTEHKISIGVMTSFEMVRTSTVINKEVLQTNENAQIQCNRSQISIKEVISKEPTASLNFLDGITPVSKNSHQRDLQNNITQVNDTDARNQTIIEEKTLNEQSLYNVQVDNAITPMMSPEQTLYLDVRDYSNSESTSSDDHSNVGWTYYNKVMTHVNGLLQDSDMPSSASALYRNTRQQCVQMQIDKTNVSVTKRVKFGDDPLGIHQPNIYTTATDTSLKMNQLAAKYLKTTPVARVAKPTTIPFDMSFATRNYMEKHRLMHGLPSSKLPPPADIPRFLDITALKKQPKLL